MAKSIHRVTTEIQETEIVTPGVRMIRLADPDNWSLPPFSPGAHIDVHLPSGLIRQYSLCGDPEQHLSYFIGVREEHDGRGGSREMHTLKSGQELLVSLPRNHFPLVDASRIVLVAGGIGITPILSMAYELAARNREFCIHYSTPSVDRSPFRGDLVDLAGCNLVFHHSQSGDRLDIPNLIDSLDKNDHLYCCGPKAMMDEMIACGQELGERLHIEYFGSNVKVTKAAYNIQLVKSGRKIQVIEGQTMLEALRTAGVNVPSSCEGGICLECKTRYIDGVAVHRDLAMSAGDRTSYLTPCVSGCEGSSISLDL